MPRHHGNTDRALVKPRKKGFDDVVHTEDMVRLFSVSRPTLSNWIEAGMPKLSRGRFSLSATIAWALERERKRVDERLEDLGFEEQDARLKKAQAGLRELDLAERRGLLMLRDEHRRLVSEMVSSAMAHMRSMPSNMAPKLAHQDEVFIQTELTQEINDILTDLARRGAKADAPGGTTGDRAVGVSAVDTTEEPQGKRVGRRAPVHPPRGKPNRTRKVAHKPS
jgi:phage terminase Nu1 subunit (DNA packaging protein)